MVLSAPPSSFVLQAMLVLGAIACSEPDRTFAEGTGGGAASTTGGAGGSPSSTTQGTGTGGAGTGTTTGPGAGGSGGGTSTAAGPLCGDGDIDAGEECDEVSELCSGCLFDCPAGWLRVGDSCFAVALGDVVQVNGLEGLARCGALDASGTLRRAHPATPASAEQFAALAAACPANGCWLGYLALGDPTTGGFVAPSTGEELFAEAPWGAAQPSRGAREVCTRLRSAGDPAEPLLEDVDCTVETAYSACELELSWGSNEDCDDGDTLGDEECDGDVADGSCVGCNRVCRADEIEDPRTHACLFAEKDSVAFDEAGGACLALHEGSNRATPDEIADVRVLQFVGPGWLGLEVTAGAPAWQGGETFTYEVGSYPLGPDAPTDGFAGVLGEDGLIDWEDPSGGLQPALCDIHQPG